ncbi:hypothetical protein [Halorhabdus amylolytica]|uniref:hypothetical protein n=1 Tax=Halorhabdus amylolytica TaxID=2559573 RepID=UPI0010A9DD60|nr:hypothetical protein [Halorhabdus amylolytica]
MTDNSPFLDIGLLEIDFEPLAPWRALRRAQTIDDVTSVILDYGWAGPMLGLLLHILVRTILIYVMEPIVIISGYLFDGAAVTMIVVFVYTSSFVLLAVFLYFGGVGAIAGFLSDERQYSPAVFKLGGYVSVLFIPLFLIGIVLALTVSGEPYPLPSEPTANATTIATELAQYRREILTTPQMYAIRVLRMVGWAVIGFLILPIVGRLYELDRKRSVLSVLPPTMAALFLSGITWQV